MRTAVVLLLAACTISNYPAHGSDTPARDESPKPASLAPKEALQPFNGLVGSWKGSGMPEGTKEERIAGAWEETIAWEWKFKEKDAWLTLTFTKGKYFTKGELRYTPDKDKKEPRFTLALTTVGKATETYVGGLDDKGKVLTLTRTDGPAKRRTAARLQLAPRQPALVPVRHAPGGNDHRVHEDVPSGARRKRASRSPTCRRARSASSAAERDDDRDLQGQTYYVCCSGCRDEFKANPEKYIKEAEAKAKEKK